MSATKIRCCSSCARAASSARLVPVPVRRIDGTEEATFWLCPRCAAVDDSVWRLKWKPLADSALPAAA